MRSLKALYTIPAHLSNVSDVRFFRANDKFFVEPPTATTQDADVEMKDETSPQNGDAAKVGSQNGDAKDGPDAEAKDPQDASVDKSSDKPDTSAYTWEEWKYRSGLFFASAGYDGLVKLWSADDWQLLRTLPTDGGKVMSVDLSSDAKLLASGTYNRNFQLFAPEELPV